MSGRPETKSQFEFEDAMNKYMDIYYKDIGYSINWNGDRQKDVTLYYNNMPTLVEHKYRQAEYPDILVEIMQDVESHDLGWLYLCGADDLHYIICLDKKPRYYYSIPMNKFKIWFFKWLKNKKYPQYRTSLDGWGITLNLAVPINEIPIDLIKRYEIPEYIV